MQKQFKGLYTAIITPFNEGDQEIDHNALTEIVEEQVESNVDGIVAVGSTGESATLTPEEHRIVVKSVIDIVDGRTTVIAGTGSNSTAEAVQYSQHAQEDGADGVLVITPYYNKPSQKGLLAHFKSIADSIDIPVILYNIPGRTGVNIDFETVMELSKHPMIVGVKEASGDHAQTKKIIENTDDSFSVLSGNDDETIKLMQMGGDGVIAVASNIIPREMKEMVDAGLTKDWDQAARLQEKYAALLSDLFIETNPMPIKTLMAHTGRCKQVFRLPLTDLYPENEQKLIQTWDDFKNDL
ncbi:MAG: 4-hydroxy-tetrahydrodipicolinate synthase [Alphaproteobacteria bacterium]